MAPAASSSSSDSVPPALIIVMGVSGCGKSTLGSKLADALKIPFYDGDSLHPQSNVDKMANGIPLTDADREPWLALIRSTADRICERPPSPSIADPKTERVKGVVIACSALKRTYRDLLRGLKPESHQPPPASDLPEDHPIVDAVDRETEAHLLEEAASDELRTFFVFLDGPKEVLEERMKNRKGHFMKAAMLESQLKTLESPKGEEGVVVVNLNEAMDQQVVDAVEGLRRLDFLDTHTTTNEVEAQS